MIQESYTIANENTTCLTECNIKIRKQGLNSLTISATLDVVF